VFGSFYIFLVFAQLRKDLCSSKNSTGIGVLSGPLSERIFAQAKGILIQARNYRLKLNFCFWFFVFIV